jgi:hypothetical protein
MSIARTRAYLLARHALPTAGAAPPYATGVPITSPQVGTLSGYAWPTHAAVPWKQGSARGRFFRFGVFQGNVEIPSQQEDVQTWDRHGVDLRWSHLHFVWEQGKQYTVRGLSREAPIPAPATPLHVVETPGQIAVETGVCRVVVNTKRFTLFDQITFAPHPGGPYTVPILAGAGGPEIHDHGTLYAARFDPDVTVTVDAAGPIHAVIKAKGLYRDQVLGEPAWAAFTTRLHFWAGQPWIRVVHSLGYREDMSAHEYDRAAIVIPFHFAERFAFPAVGDPAANKQDFATLGGADVYLHQDRFDSYRLGTDAQLGAQHPVATGTRSANCWAIQGAGRNVRVECYLRNGWQEYPFEARLGPREMGISMQPWHGYETFGALDGAAHVGEQHLHKLRYAHSGCRQRQGLPAAYVKAFQDIDAGRGELSETRAEDAAGANWQGMMLRQDFYLRILRDTATSLAAFDTSDLIDVAALVQQRPIAIPDPQHVQDSFVFGPIGTRADGYPEVFDYATSIIKGDYNPDRGEYYGRFRWGAMPHTWWVDLKRPSWHRLEYGDSHYDRIALIFWYYMATQDADLLALARRAVKFHQCVRFVNFASTTDLANHAPMAQWHKGLSPCAEVTGDDAAVRSGHSLHAYAMLLGWLIDADRDLLDAYRCWSHHAKHNAGGRDRNTNNNLHEAIQQYEFTHDRQVKHAVRAIAAVLMSEPMSAPAGAGRDWDQAWPLYLDLLGGKGVRRFFEKEATPGQWLHGQSAGFAHMALAYRVTGDPSFLHRALSPLRSRVLRGVFRPPTGDGPYSPAFFQNIYGQPETHKTLLHLMYYLKSAGIAVIPEDDREPGQYPVGRATISSQKDTTDRGTWIAISNPTGRAFTLQVRWNGADALGAYVYAPDRSLIRGDVLRLSDKGVIEQARASGWGEYLAELPIPGRGSGLYHLFTASTKAGVFLPTTADQLLECAVIRNNAERFGGPERVYDAYVMRMYIVPATTAHAIDWTFRPFLGAPTANEQNGCRIRIHDATGLPFVDTYLMRTEMPPVSCRMNGPGDPPPPWRIDCGGVGFTIDAASEAAFRDRVDNLALVGPDPAALTTIKPLILDAISSGMVPGG